MHVSPQACTDMCYKGSLTTHCAFLLYTLKVSFSVRLTFALQWLYIQSVTLDLIILAELGWSSTS